MGFPGRCWLPAPFLAWGLCGGGGFGRAGVASVVPTSLSMDAGVDGMGLGAGLRISLEMRSLALVNRSLGFPIHALIFFFFLGGNLHLCPPSQGHLPP